MSEKKKTTRSTFGAECEEIYLLLIVEVLIDPLDRLSQRLVLLTRDVLMLGKQPSPRQLCLLPRVLDLTNPFGFEGLRDSDDRVEHRHRGSRVELERKVEVSWEDGSSRWRNGEEGLLLLDGSMRVAQHWPEVRNFDVCEMNSW